ncbi:MAG: hypothetical protein H6742_19500 [Alphaproteobacteria bacterium]|nr:hypothetical protein [Alphaproteobacteria bacterium]
MDFDAAFDPFRALRHGMEAFKREPAPVIAAGFLMFLLDACQGQGNRVQNPPQGTGMDEEMAMVFLAIACFACGLGLVVFAIKAFVEPGAWRVGARMTQDGTSGMDVLFSGKDAWLPMLGYKLLMGVILLGVFVVSAAPGGGLLALGALPAMDGGGEPNVPLLAAGVFLIALIALPVTIYVTLGLQLGNLAISLDGVGTMEALDRSWTMAKGNRFRLFWFNLVHSFVGFAGFMLCCVGAIPARGLIICSTANAYLMFTREDYEDMQLVKEIGAY